MVRDLLRGFSFALSGLQDVSSRPLRRFVLAPLLINIVLFAGLIWGAAGLFSGLMEDLLGWLPDWMGFLDWLLWPLFFITSLLMMFYLFTVAANLLGSPFNGLLSERVEQHFYPGVVQPQSGPLWREVARAPWIEIRKLTYFLVRAIPLLLLFLVPGLNAAAPLLWLAFCAWILALEYMDYPLSNHGVPLLRQRALLAEHRPLALGFGAAVLLMTLVPVLNFLVMPAAVIGATRLWAEVLRPGSWQ